MVCPLAKWPSATPEVKAGGVRVHSGNSDSSIAQQGLRQEMDSSSCRKRVEFLQAPESTTLANYGRVYETLEQLNPFPANKEDLIPLILAVPIPAFPVIIAEIPVATVLSDLFHALR